LSAPAGIEAAADNTSSQAGKLNVFMASFQLIGRYEAALRKCTGSPPLGNSELLSPKSRPIVPGIVQYPTCMKIYFGFTVAGDRSALETARRLVQLLEGLGHEVLTRHLVNDDAWGKDRLISPQDVYRRDMAWLQQCEVLIAEVSGSSFGLGFETGYLLGATAKKVILFYRRDLEKKISLLITGNTHPNCTLAPYSNVTDVESFITSNLSGEPGAAELQSSSNSGMSANAPQAKVVHGGSE
jgi:2'-deoxynucleoside 5'-phosphate N-hydrolase